MLLTAELLLSYQRCERRAFLDVYGDPEQLDPIGDFHLKLQQDRFAQERTVLAGKIYRQPEYRKGDWQAGARATLELMHQGVEAIYQGVLLAQLSSDRVWDEEDSCSLPSNDDQEDAVTQRRGDGSSENFPVSECQSFRLSSSPRHGVPPSPRLLPHTAMQQAGKVEAPRFVTLLSCADLLVKQPGESIFGDWCYVPYQIELGKRPKQDYQIIAAFHAFVLAAVQESLPETAWLILRDRPPYQVNLPKVMPKMQGVLHECIALLQQQEEPEVFISRQRCNLCRWYSHCYALAQFEQHLSLIPGVSPSRYSYLRSLNLTTVESLAGADVDWLEPTIERDIAIQLVRQAQSVWQNKVILSDSPPFAADALPTAPIELYFDIEAEPDINLDYLLGVLVVDRAAKTEKFYPFLAERPEDEGLIWEQFLELVSCYPDAPIFHFCDYEVETVKRLAKCYKTPYDQVKSIQARFVDIHSRVKQAVTLPVQSYALKHIARWLGFEWQNPQANGQLCIYWYDQWLKVSDRHYLDAILRYNEDDCRATLLVKDWLVNLIEDSQQNPA
ncbi:TM0106 family RecB-like putative nuclease [Microseira wollei]|uniref:YprB ribonuclease H-like domain-containing protein n=1 Tax=Microseira wollei NIES-4236 TaxID=2530354 RepID=A0AAV3XJE4_9CYAN|nr:TM0106 family RecB-like putative nuclease [Microseira wollei]GET39597.1 hypothetical protein MiSe_43680 [Microseira wollei NIES-4236]